MSKRLMVLVGFFVLAAFMLSWAQAPTNIEDFHLAGTQPNQVTLEQPNRCGNCHGGYDPAVEMYSNWQGSMMAQSMRDPLFQAFMVIANQDAPESGDLCIRCHTPEGWLEGRSTPTDGSALTTRDFVGIACDFCHKLVKPVPLGTNPYPDDPDYTAGTFDADQSELAAIVDIPPQSGNGMYCIAGSNDKRGPFVDAQAKHKMLYSPFHQEAALCGTCHDVSNPAFDRQPDNTYTPNGFGVRPSSANTYDMYPIERTYSEWLMSDYNTPEGVPSDVFGGNKTNVSTCQDCHMRDVTGFGCNKRGVPLRDDLPLHDLTGGNTFVPGLVAQLYPADVIPSELQRGVDRATVMLQSAATMNVSFTPQGTENLVNVHIINETGHKLPSGYPEGRRIWINVQAFDDGGTLVYESGAYDPNTGVLDHDSDVKIYEIKPGISDDLAATLGMDAGPSFHFVLNNTVYKDNRIPARGFTNANYESIQSPVIGYSYDDGQYWDDTQYLVPGSASRVEVTLYYQTTSKEFMEFLRDENVTDDKGQIMYDLWDTNGKSAPVAMNTETLLITTNPPVADFVGTPTSGYTPMTVNFSDLSTNSPTSWSWTFGDGGTSTEQNPSYTYTLPGIYDVSLTATNAFGSDTKTMVGYISATEMTLTEMHVSDIIVTTGSNKGRTFGIATVTILDAVDAPVAGATVTGDFSGAVSQTVSGVTDASGQVVLESRAVKNVNGEFCFTVTDVSKTDAIYNDVANVVTTACESGPVAKGVSGLIPGSIMLAQNYPNPFNPTTVIDFYLPNASDVKFEIFNISGQLITTLADGHRDAGHHTVEWDASNYPSGVYLYRLSTQDFNKTMKMVLMK